MQQNLLAERKKKYFLENSNYISQSTLKKYQFPYLPKNPNFQPSDLYHEEKDYSLEGTLADEILCGGNIDEYYVLNKNPSKEVKSICHFVHDNLVIGNNHEVIRLIISSPDFDKFDNRIKDKKKKLKMIIEQGKEYFECLQRKEIPISEDSWKTATNVAESMKRAFGDKWFQYDTYNQVAIYLEIPRNGHIIKVKALLDKVVIKNNKVYIIDIKTTGKSTLDFPRAVVDYGYDIQGVWYTMLFQMMMHTDIIQPDEQTEELRQRVLNENLDYDTEFTFLVESTKNQGFPLEYCMDNDKLTETFENKLQPLINNYIWSLENPDSIYNKEYTANGFKINL